MTPLYRFTKIMKRLLHFFKCRIRHASILTPKQTEGRLYKKRSSSSVVMSSVVMSSQHATSSDETGSLFTTRAADRKTPLSSVTAYCTKRVYSCAVMNIHDTFCVTYLYVFPKSFFSSSRLQTRSNFHVRDQQTLRQTTFGPMTRLRTTTCWIQKQSEKLQE